MCDRENRSAEAKLMILAILLLLIATGFAGMVIMR